MITPDARTGLFFLSTDVVQLMADCDEIILCERSWQDKRNLNTWNAGLKSFRATAYAVAGIYLK